MSFDELVAAATAGDGRRGGGITDLPFGEWLLSLRRVKIRDRG